MENRNPPKGSGALTPEGAEAMKMSNAAVRRLLWFVPMVGACGAAPATVQDRAQEVEMCSEPIRLARRAQLT